MVLVSAMATAVLGLACLLGLGLLPDRWRGWLLVVGALLCVAAAGLGLIAARQERASRRRLGAELADLRRRLDREAEAHRREHEAAERQQAAFHQLEVACEAGSWHYDPEADELRCDEAAAAFWGCDPSRVWSWDEAWGHLVGPDDEERSIFRHRLLEQGEPASCEGLLAAEDGASERVLICARSVCADGEVLAVLGSIQSIEERRRNEHDAKRFRAISGTVLAGIGEAVITCDPDGIIERFGAAAEEMTGFSRSRAIGKRVAKVVRLLDPQSRETMEDPVSAVRRRGKRLPQEMGILLDRHGNERRVSFTALPVNLDGVLHGVVVVCADIGNRLRLEEKFREAQKLETIGRLAGGIAHDFNNLLCGIIGYADALHNDHELSERNRKRSGSILDAASRATELTQQLLSNARRGRRRDARIDCHHLIGEVMGMLRHTVDPSIRLVYEPGEEHMICIGDQAQLHSALLNLAVNARDAMPEGGELRISTTIAIYNEEDEACETMGVRPGRYLLIHVADTGQGMDQQTQGRIFEPFFTTKAIGKGTGLGLSAVYGTMRDHGGAITVRSAPGRGSIFTLHIPIMETDEESAVKRVRTARFGRGELVLVVDDEEIVRQMANDMLSDHGYVVTTAADGREALDCFKANLGQVKLVLLDVVMPQMNGTTARQRLREIDPQIPIIMCSGCNLDEARDVFRDGRPCGYLQKPFTAATLHAAVAEQLNLEQGSTA